MDKKELKDLSKKELVELVCDIADAKRGDVQRLPPSEAVRKERIRRRKQEKIGRSVAGTLGLIAVVAAIAVLLSTYLFPVIQVSGDSMEPTLHNGDILLLLKSGEYESGQLCCVSWQNKLLIKRVIALPGDYIDIDREGTVYVNGIPLDEPYVTEKSLGECDIVFPYQIPDGKVFVMGDRRDTSVDSRSSSVGCISYDQIVGRVLFRVWPMGGE